MGLPAELRLRRSPDITLVVRRGRRVRAGGLVLHCLRRHEAGAVTPDQAATDGTPGDDAGNRVTARRGPRVAFVAPRTSGPAVRRNRARRRVQELLRAQVDAGSLAADVDLVVRLQPEATAAGSGDLGRWLATGLHRLGVLT